MADTNATLDELIEDCVDEEETVDVEINEGVIIKQGPAELKGGDRKAAFKPVWIVLVSGSLFWYKDSKLKSVKGVIHLNGSTVQGDDLITIDKIQIKLLTSGDKADWTAALTAAIKLPKGEAPSMLTVKSAGGKTKSALAGKIATSGVGKGMVKGLMNDEAKNLVKCVKNCVTAVFSKKDADTVENNLIKTYVKAHFLAENGTIDSDWYKGLDKYLRDAFEVTIRITDNVVSKIKIPEETLKEWIGKVQDKLRQVEKILYELLKEHLQPKSLNRITETFVIFTDYKFLRTILVDFNSAGFEHLKKDAENLQITMERFLAITW